MTIAIPAALQPVLGSIYPHRPRVLYILRKRAGASREAFAGALRGWRESWGYAVAPGSIAARAGAAMVEEQQQIDGRFGAGGMEVTAFDGYVSLDLECYEPGAEDFARLFDTAKGCLDSLAEVADLAQSVALAGVANLVIPGGGPMSMILVLDRLPSLSLEEYNAWWVHHADDHRRFNPAQTGYHQLHIAPEFNEAAARAAGTTTMPQCIIDIMYLGHLRDAFPKPGERSEAESKALNADIGKHVSFAGVSGSFFQEL